MDLEKDQSHLKLHQTPDPHPQKTCAPEIIGTWSLRSREQLRKRKAEAQEMQMSQWLLGEQKKRKCKGTGKRNQRSQKRQQNINSKLELPSQTEQETTEKKFAPAEKETGHPVTEALVLVSPLKAVPAEHCSEIHQCQENSSKYQETAIQNHSSQTHQNMAKAEEDLFPNMCQETAVPQEHSSKVHQDMDESEILYPNMYQETAVPQEHSSKVYQDMTEHSPNICQETAMPQNYSSKAYQIMAEPEIFFPKTCQEIGVLQDHPLKMCQNVADPEVLAPKTCQETVAPKTLPYTTPGDAAGPGCSPETSPRSDVPEGCPLDTSPKLTGPEKFTSTLEQGTDITEDFLPQTQISLSEAVFTKTHKEAIEPKYSSYETYKEITVPSDKTIQETPGPEGKFPETCQQTPGPEKYAPETYQETPGPEQYSPEMYQEAPGESPDTYQEMPGPEDLSIKTCKHRDGPKYEMEEKAKADQGLQEICPENDSYSYALF
uniref:Hemogen n=1 Tax=Nannospalax galili TaxID=1026970 RepID=A0A8C6QVL8_NANGA